MPFYQIDFEFWFELCINDIWELDPRHKVAPKRLLVERTTLFPYIWATEGAGALDREKADRKRDWPSDASLLIPRIDTESDGEEMKTHNTFEEFKTMLSRKGLEFRVIDPSPTLSFRDMEDTDVVPFQYFQYLETFASELLRYSLLPLLNITLLPHPLQEICVGYLTVKVRCLTRYAV